MAVCSKKHFVKRGNSLEEVNHYYIAGICVVDPIHQGTMEMFLRSTYPFYHGSTYESSKRMQQTMVPNNIRFATESIDLEGLK